MSCETILMQLLEAEPDELRGMADTPLTQHLRACSRCAAVAERLLLDTAQLAFTVRASQGSAEPARRRASRWWLLPVGAMTVAALLVWRGHEQPSAESVTVTAAVVEPSASPGIATPVVVAQVTRPSSGERERAPPGLRRLRVRPLPQLVAYQVDPVIVEPEPAPTPVTVTPTPRARSRRAMDARGAVIVEPPPSKRATILRSAVPGVTIVWLN